MPLLFMDATTPGTENISDLATSVTKAVTDHITLAQVGTALTVIIGAGIVAMFAWKFGRKGFAFIKNALSGKPGKM